jgi:hypothetical protein
MTTFLAPLRSTAASSRAGLSKTQAASALFAIMAAVFLAWPVWRLGLPLEINRNEAWNAWFIQAVLEGARLYPASNELIINNYPPLSFYLTAAAAKLTGDAIVAGRLLALLSAGLAGLAAALCVRALGGSRGAAALAGFWLVATLARFFSRYVGVNDPSLPGLAFMGLALAYFLHLVRRGHPAGPAIALMVLAGFVKHNMPALPLAALLWLAMSNGRAAIRAALAGAALCALGAAICVAAFGPDFIAQMTAPREIGVKHMLSTVNKLQWIAPALLFWGIWAWPNRREPATRFSALLLALSLLSGLIQAAGAGVTYNAYFEAVFASAIATGVAFEGLAKPRAGARLSAGTMQTVMIAVLALRLVLAQQLEPYLVIASPAFRDQVRENAAVFEQQTARVASLPGPVSCSIMTVCFRAGKAFVYDGFWAEQLIAKGKWTKDAVDEAVAARGIRQEAIDPRASVDKMRLF